METCCRYKDGMWYLWPSLGKWKDERWIGALGLCGRKVKGQGQRRVLPSCTGQAVCTGYEEWLWMLVGVISEQNNLFRNWGACVDTIFWHVSRKVIFVKRRWPIWKKPKDAQGWNRPMEVCPMGQENILRSCWSASSGIRPMKSYRWSQGRRRGSGLYKNRDDSVVVFRVVYL